ncbi:glycosyl hydrolase family 28-related protein [Tunturiibacter psychrotolerans]|uniref:glycosyl hydrolase family 28-related protein n=1 Tax=Tunturiibacter psychrotolerans TaxID=3069686 RepID=UPI003D193111
MYRIRGVFAVWCCSLGLLLELGCGAGITQSTTNQLSIEPQPPQLFLGQTVQLHATLSYSDGTSADVTSSAAWSTAASSIASVSSRGLLSCAAAGSTRIIVTINGVTTSSALNCSTAQLILSGIRSPQLVGQTTKLDATLHYGDGTTTDVSSSAVWSTTSTSVAQVSSDGLLTCIASGSTQITVALDGPTSSAIAEVQCADPLLGLNISPPTASVRVGSPTQLSASAMLQSGTSMDVTDLAVWSSTSTILTVSANGLLSCISAGTAVVSASYPPLSKSVSVTCAPSSLNTPSYFMEASDEFVGPFSSWTNIKTAYGAAGDGKTDDTNAIQRALDDLNGSNASPVLWFPSGIYVISRPLTITHKAYFSLIGEDPSTTQLTWKGGTGGTMLQTDGSSYFRISRLSFDGEGAATTAENLSTLTSPGGYYSTFIELSDQHIKGVKLGIELGVDAETTVERVFFDHISSIGLSVETFNTLNIFVNDSLFLNCGTAVSNTLGAGSFIVSNSFFKESQISDMSIINTSYFTARHNTSVSSQSFFTAYQFGANNATITIQNNTILDPKTSPFFLGDLGPLMLIDNVVRMTDSSVSAVLGNWDLTALKDLFSFGNIYTPNPGPLTDGGSIWQGRIDAYDDTITMPSSIPDVSIPDNVYVPPNLKRTIFEVESFTGAAIQTAIDQAVASGISSPVVHVPAGHYQVMQTITIPPESTIQLIGDDAYGTLLQGDSSLSGPVLRIDTSNAAVKYLGVSGTHNDDGIVLSIADQPSTQIILDEAELQSGNAYSVNFDGVEHATAELFSTYTLGSITGVNVTGGPFRVKKEGTLGVTNHYTGSLQSMAGATSFSVTSNGKYMVQDNWHDAGGTGPFNFILSGSGTVTEQSGTVYTNSAQPFDIGNFDGNISLIGLQFQGGFLTDPGQSHTNLLNLGLTGSTQTYLPESTGNLVVNNLLDSYYNLGGGHIPEQDSPDVQWLRSMFAQSRVEYPIERKPVVSGAHRIRLARVLVQNTLSALHIMPEAASTGLYYSIKSGDANLSASSDQCVTSTGLSGAATQWIMTPAGDGDFQLLSASMDEALALAQGGSTVTLQPPTSAYNQRWLIQNFGDGTFRLKNRATNGLLSSSMDGNGCLRIGLDGDEIPSNWNFTAH